MKGIPEHLELGDYLPTGPAEHRGPMASCLVRLRASEETYLAEWLEASQTSVELFNQLRQQWRSNGKRQPAGSLCQRMFHENQHRLVRVIDLPAGRPLNDWMFASRFPLAEVLETAISLTKCLADWHRMSRLHGALDGETIFRNQENGIELRDALDVDVLAQKDLLSLSVDRVFFLSPETSGSLSRELSPSSDLYSVGAILFGLLAGRPPIEAADASDFLDRQLCLEPPRLRELGLDIPPLLDDLVARLLRRDPRDRYETAEGLLFDLEHIARVHRGRQADEPFAIGTQDVRQKPVEASLVGREGELRRIQKAILEARAGRSGLQVITGADRGQRRLLLDEIGLRAKSQGLYLFRGGASTTSNPRPLQWLEPVLARVMELCQEDPALAGRLAHATREHAETLASILPGLQSQWPTVDPQTGPDAFGSQRAAVALEELFAALGQEATGLAFLFDDLDLADELAQTLVRSLAQRLERDRESYLLCVVSSESQPSVALSNHVKPLCLSAISPQALQMHLASSAGKIEESITQSILDVADGSPMKASAIFGRMVDTGVVKPSAEGWLADEALTKSLRADESFAEILERQVNAVSAPALRVLSTAAVIGQHFDLAMLAYVAEASYEEVLGIALDALRRRLLWRGARPAQFQFAHDQIHRQLQERLTVSERRRLHRAAAAYLEEHEAANVFDLAYHYDAAGEGQPALRNALRGAQVARQRFSLSVARDQLEIAKRWMSSSDRQVALEVSEGLGEIHLLAGRYEQAALDLQEARSLAKTPLEKARVQQQIGELAFKRGHFADAASEFEGALAMTGVPLPANALTMCCGLLSQTIVQTIHTWLPPRWIARQGAPGELDCLRLQLLSRLSRVYWFSRHKLWTLGNHLRSLNEAERFVPSAILAAYYSEHGPVMSLLGWFRRANRYATRSLEIREQLGDVWGQGQSQHYHCVVMLAECRFQDAIDMSRRAIGLLRQTGDVWEMNMARYQTANALYRIGRLEEAAEIAAQMFYSGREIGDVQASGISLDVWARSAAETLPLETVAEEAARFRHDAQSHAQTQLGYAVALLHHRHTDKAIETLRSAIDRCREAGHLNVYISPCYAWLVTALRCRIEETDKRDGRRLAQLHREAQQAAAKAARVARRFPADRAHALRERAILCTMRGKTKGAAWFLQKSLAEARARGQQIEELDSLQVLRGLHQREADWLGPLPVSLAARLAELAPLRATGPRQESSSEPHSTNLSLADRFVTVLKSGRRIARSLSAEDVYVEASEAARRLLRGQHGEVVMISQETEDLQLRPWRPSPTPHVSQQRIEINGEVIRTAVRMGRAVNGDGFEEERAGATGSVVAAPILFRGTCVAVILVAHDELQGLFGDDELRIAEFMATLAGAALENADGFLRLQQLNETLEQRVQERTQAAEDRACQLARSNQQLRATEEQLREAIVQARSANAAKSRFLATISHEIRTPLNGILGMTRLAQKSPHDPRHSGYLDTVQESGESLLNLINDLLDFSKLEADKVELEEIPFDLQQLGGEVSRLMAASAWQKSIELVCDIDPHLPAEMLGDPSRLRQVLMNLMGNAIKFTEQGSIAMTIEKERGEGGAEQLSISVRDSGIGIPEDKRTIIFESFSQVDSSTTRRYGGTGLGLAISRELIEKMGGTIEVASELGIGSTFTIRLPWNAAGPAKKPAATLLGKRVAIIDPLKASRRSITRSLQAVGAQVADFTQVEDVCFETASPPWDLIVCGDAEAETRVAQAAAKIPRLFLSPAHAQLQLNRGTRSSELRKPAIGREIIAVAESLLRGAAGAATEKEESPAMIASVTIPGQGERADRQVKLGDAVRAAPADEAIPEPGPSLPGESAQPSFRVLVAEDGVINQDVIVGILQMQGHEVVLVSDGEEAVQRALQDPFDICLMDVDMPRMDGIEATMRIRQRLPPRQRSTSEAQRVLPIVAMTAHSGEEIWSACQSAGMDGHLPKPIEPETLASIIEGLCGQVATPAS